MTAGSPVETSWTGRRSSRSSTSRPRTRGPRREAGGWWSGRGFWDRVAVVEVVHCEAEDPGHPVGVQHRSEGRGELAHPEDVAEGDGDLPGFERSEERRVGK